jgi:hypothetical protein
MPDTILQISPNGRYFLDASGAPFFWLGDTQWQLCHGFSLPDVEAILKDRRNKGFNVIQVMITGVGDGTIPSFAGQTPWLKDDPSTPNPAYFEHLDAIVRLADKNGLILALYLCHNAQRDFITLANARTYARWVASRYRNNPNILWVFVTDIPLVENLPLIRELVAGVQEGDGGSHLISYHPDPAIPALSSGEIHNEPWLAFNMIQVFNYYEGIWGMVTRDYRRTPPKPVVMAEAAYEAGMEYGFPVTPLVVRKQAYYSVLAGGFHSYGHSDNWRIPPTWKEGLSAPGAQQMSVLKRIFCERNWWDLVPDQKLIVSQPNEGTTLNVAARSAQGDWAMIYLGLPTAFSVIMNRLQGPASYEAFWIHPETGLESSISSYSGIGTISSSDILYFTTPPGWPDALLWIRQRR